MPQRRPVSARIHLPARAWSVSAAAVIVVGGVLAGTMLASAAAPALPRQTPAQLLAAMRQAKLPHAMTATLNESANLGFPALPDIGGLSSSPLAPASLVSGSHTIQIWYAGPRQLRVALPVSFGETDLRVNNNQVWLWESRGQVATHILPPPATHFMRPGRPAMHAQPGGGAPPVPLTPLQAARKLLALVGPTTRVTVPGTIEVAGRAAYQLAIAPRSAQSLVGRILIAVDAQTHLPLSVQVFARGASSPAFQLGFTSLSFARPAASNFTFTPPPGAKVKTVRLRAGGHGVMPGAGPPSQHSGPPPSMPATGQSGWSGAPPTSMPGPGPLVGARTFGSGWLTVADIPAGLALSAASAHARPGHMMLMPRSAGQAGSAFQSGLATAGPAGGGLGLLTVLLKAAKPVHGSWGSGRLLRTSLFSVLLTKGHLLAGAVTPAVLYADAAKIP